MACITGTCVGHLALLDVIKTFLTSNGWTCLADRQEIVADTTSYAPSSTSHRTMYFKGTGLAGEDEVFIGFQDWQWSGLGMYNIALQGFTGFDTNLNFWTQPGAFDRYQSSADYINLNLACSEVELAYWIVANGRRVIIITRHSTSYCCAYLGLFLPYCRPNQYPYPLFVGGSSNRLRTKFSTQDNGNTNFWQQLGMYNSSYSGTPYYDRFCTAAYFNTQWHRLYYKSPSSDLPANGNSILLNCGVGMSGAASISILSTGVNADGSRWLFPVSFGGINGAEGVLDGVFNVNGASANAEDTITVGSGTYLLVPNIYRPAEEQFAAIKLE